MVNTWKNISIVVFTFVAFQVSLTICKAQSEESDYYRIDQVTIPQDIALEVGGLAFDDQGRLGAITRRGELWVIQDPSSGKPSFTRFAHGLHEPLGLAFKNGSFYTNQRGELTRITDNDQDDLADLYESIVTWELNGNYHEYSYGPVFLPDGDMLVTLNLGWIGRGESGSKWRGWMLKVTEEGAITPYATGLRSPAGFGLNASGDIFFTENQGDWVGSGRMTHLELGDFAGNPEGLKWSAEPGSPIRLNFEDIDDTKGYTLYEYRNEIPEIKPPSVWFPHTLMGISTSDIIILSEKMGPFADQLLVGDQGHSKVMRVYQEKINGTYQGVCFPFVEGFASGVLRFAYSPDKDAIYVGQTNRGWASTGTSPYALERLSWTGKVPFEIEKINVTKEGFLLTFTQPVDPVEARDPGSYGITDFTYLYHHFYGSPVQQKQSRGILSAEVAQDALSVHLKIDRFRKGFIYEIKAPGIKSSNGSHLLHELGYYTLNEVPEGSEIIFDGKVQSTQQEDSPKRVTAIPEEWNGQIDLSLDIGTLPGLKFDKTELEVTSGSKIKLTFNNSDDMPHNLVLVAPGKADEVGMAAMQLGLDGESRNYVPDSEAVWAHSNLVPPAFAETIYFTAPQKPGYYEFVCTFPGHHISMRGTLKVLPAGGS